MCDIARSMRAQLIEEFGGKCDTCESTDKLEFAHLEPTGLSGMGRGSKERARDVMKNKDKYALKCKPCHKQFDSDRGML